MHPDLPPVLLALARSDAVALHRGRAGHHEGEGLDADGRDAAFWAEVIETAETHGVGGLVYPALRALVPAAEGSPAFAAFRARTLARLHLSLRLRHELPLLCARLGAGRVRALGLKGPVLAALAYGDPALRPTTDLDVLVRKGDVPRALEMLAALGFVPEHALQPDYDSHWQSYTPLDRPYGNANGYVRDRGGPSELHVDLHWGLAARYLRLPLDPAPLWERAIEVEVVPGQAVSTLGLEDTLLHLAIHGAKHTFDRLTYVADVAELLRAQPGLDVPLALERARAVGAERMVLVALALAADLLGAPLAAPVRARAARPDVARLARRLAAWLFVPARGARRFGHLAALHLGVRDRWVDGLGSVYLHARLAFPIRPGGR